MHDHISHHAIDLLPVSCMVQGICFWLTLLCYDCYQPRMQILLSRCDAKLALTGSQHKQLHLNSGIREICAPTKGECRV